MSGSPFAGDPQSGWGYLPAMIAFTIAPSIAGYIGFITFHVVLAAAGTYLYARVIGIRPIGAFAAGATFTFGNFMELAAYQFGVEHVQFSITGAKECMAAAMTRDAAQFKA